MSIKEMWNYLIFQTKGYRQLGAAIVAGAVCGAGISYINSILYARIIDTLLLEEYTTAVHYVWIMILAVLVVRLIYIMCNQIFEQYASPSRNETKRRTAEKAFSMEFEEIEKEENQIAFRRTRGGVNGAGDIEAQLDSIYKFFTLGKNRWNSIMKMSVSIFCMVICLKSLHRRRRRRISGFMECRVIFVEKMRHVSMHHPIFQKKGFSRGKIRQSFHLWYSFLLVISMSMWR